MGESFYIEEHSFEQIGLLKHFFQFNLSKKLNLFKAFLSTMFPNKHSSRGQQGDTINKYSEFHRFRSLMRVYCFQVNYEHSLNELHFLRQLNSSKT
jgi:hypothetical protein